MLLVGASVSPHGVACTALTRPPRPAGIMPGDYRPSGSPTGVAMGSSLLRRRDAVWCTRAFRPLARRISGPASGPGHDVGHEAGLPTRRGGQEDRLRRRIADHTVGTIVVEHRARVTRFGFEYMEAALAGRGARIPVMAEDEPVDDLVGDATEVPTSLCARRYGRRSARRRAERALAWSARPVTRRCRPTASSTGAWSASCLPRRQRGDRRCH